MKQALLIAGGSLGSPAFYEPLTREADFIICADSGYLNACALGVTPDVIIGDFDSSARPANGAAGQVIPLPVEKDKTDSHAALEYLLDNRYKHITMIGCTGTRLDHTLANIYLLKYALDRGAQCRLVNETNEVMLTASSLQVPRREGYKLSLLPIGYAVGVTVSGLYYPLTNGRMTPDNPYGVSNEFTADVASIEVQDGLLLVMLCRD